MPAIHDDGDVDIDDIAMAQRLGAGNAVADHVVDRSAQRVPVAAIEQRCRNRAVIEGVLPGQIVQMFRGDTRGDFAGQHVQNFRRQAPGLAHAGKTLRSMQLDTPVPRGGSGGLVGHDVIGSRQIQCPPETHIYKSARRWERRAPAFSCRWPGRPIRCRCRTGFQRSCLRSRPGVHHCPRSRGRSCS